VLSRVVQDIKVAGYKFGVYEKRESHKFLKDWSIKIQQYFYNNTNLNITYDFLFFHINRTYSLLLLCLELRG
jgi:hypothetical protein